MLLYLWFDEFVKVHAKSGLFNCGAALTHGVIFMISSQAPVH